MTLSVFLGLVISQAIFLFFLPHQPGLQLCLNQHRHPYRLRLILTLSTLLNMAKGAEKFSEGTCLHILLPTSSKHLRHLRRSVFLDRAEHYDYKQLGHTSFAVFRATAVSLHPAQRFPKGDKLDYHLCHLILLVPSWYCCGSNGGGSGLSNFFPISGTLRHSSKLDIGVRRNDYTNVCC